MKPSYGLSIKENEAVDHHHRTKVDADPTRDHAPLAKAKSSL